MKYVLCILLITLVGCNTQTTKLSTKDLVKTEGFIAYSVAVYNKTDPAKAAENQWVESILTGTETSLPDVLPNQKPEEQKEKTAPTTPKKYLRLLSAEKGCGHCIHQEQILTGSDWIIRKGTEEENEKKLPYHGLKEQVKSMRDTDNPLWDKYKAKALPHWQLVKDGKVVKTHEGVMDLEELRTFYVDGDK